MNLDVEYLKKRILICKEKYGNDKVVKEFECHVLLSNNLDLMYFFVENFNNIDIKSFIKRIIRLNDAKYIYKMAKYIGNTDEFKDAIMLCDSPKYIYKYAKNIDDEGLMEKIIKLNSPKYIYKYAKNINNDLKLSDAIINSNNEKYIYKFLLNVDDVDKVKLINYINENGCMDRLFDYIDKKYNEEIASKQKEDILDIYNSLDEIDDFSQIRNYMAFSVRKNLKIR